MTGIKLIKNKGWALDRKIFTKGSIIPLTLQPILRRGPSDGKEVKERLTWIFPMGMHFVEVGFTSTAIQRPLAAHVFIYPAKVGQNLETGQSVPSLYSLKYR